MDDIHELLPFYALDVLTQAERVAVETYLENNPSAQLELAELYAATAQLVQTIEPLTPSPQTKTNLMARVAKSMEPPPVIALPVPQVRWWQKSLFQRVMPAVSFAFALAAFIWAFTLLGSLNETQAQFVSLEATTVMLETEVETLHGAQATLVALEATATALEIEVNDLRLQNQTLSQELEREVELMQVLTSLNSEQVAFGSADSTHGLLTLNRSAETAFLTVAGLDSLTEAETYQFWLIGDFGASNAGTFVVNESGKGKLLIQSDLLQSFATLGISVEPAGGSEAPTQVIFVEDL